jgi:hypothetical protein
MMDMIDSIKAQGKELIHSTHWLIFWTPDGIRILTAQNENEKDGIARSQKELAQNNCVGIAHSCRGTNMIHTASRFQLAGIERDLTTLCEKKFDDDDPNHYKALFHGEYVRSISVPGQHDAAIHNAVEKIVGGEYHRTPLTMELLSSFIDLMRTVEADILSRKAASIEHARRIIMAMYTEVDWRHVPSNDLQADVCTFLGNTMADAPNLVKDLSPAQGEDDG